MRAQRYPLDPNSFLHIGSIYTAPVIAWPSVTNVTYVIQREFINTTNWVNIATNKASGTLGIFVDTSVTSTNSYIYRLAVFPPRERPPGAWKQWPQRTQRTQRGMEGFVFTSFVFFAVLSVRITRFREDFSMRRSAGSCFFPSRAAPLRLCAKPSPFTFGCGSAAPCVLLWPFSLPFFPAFRLYHFLPFPLALQSFGGGGPALRASASLRESSHSPPLSAAALLLKTFLFVFCPPKDFGVVFFAPFSLPSVSCFHVFRL